MGEAFKSIIGSIGGLEPEAYLILSSGFVREEWKTLCFQSGRAISARAIQSPKQLAELLVPECSGQLLDRSTRIELLRGVLKDPHLREALPKSLEHRFRPKFFDSLDRALQKGREVFVHADEATIFKERLTERTGQDERRDEFFDLNRLWESLLRVRNFYDDARLFEVATERLRNEGARLPVSTLFILEHFIPSPRVRYFLEALSLQHSLIHRHSQALFPKQSETILIEPRRTHSLEDGAHFLLDEILKSGDLLEHAIVIEDRPEVRRTIKRISEERGVLLQDARDPTLVAQAEELKTALLELELVAKNYSSELVLSWLSAKEPKNGEIRRKIIEKGITQGLESYRFDSATFSGLTELKNRYSNRMTLGELITEVKKTARLFLLPSWVDQAITRMSQDWLTGLTQLELSERKRPIRFWFQELQERLRQTPPIISPLKHESGILLFRVDQAISVTLGEKRQVHFFGVSSSFFEPRDEGSEWFSTRDLEMLASEFQIPARRDRAERLRVSISSWMHLSSSRPIFWEYQYNEGGSEQESSELIFKSIPGLEWGEFQSFPVHPKVLPSLTAKLKPSTPLVEVSVEKREFPISFLNSLGNCAFTAYAQHLLALYDERDPDFDLSGDTYGNLVHAAIEYLLSSKGKVTPSEAFQFAWEQTATLAWIKSDRLFKALRRKTLTILEVFLVSEDEYRARSKAEIVSQEEEITLKREGFTFKGRMDRVDQHADGLVLIDYKTGGAVPSGTQTLEKGKGLQLPAYALALRERKNQEVVSAQYLQLNTEKTNRNIGFLFQKWNQGKKSDQVEFPLSTARGNSGSLLQAEPESVWGNLDQKIKSLIKTVEKGEFRADPADPQDCTRCRYSNVCGRGRAVLA